MSKTIRFLTSLPFFVLLIGVSVSASPPQQEKKTQYTRQIQAIDGEIDALKNKISSLKGKEKITIRELEQYRIQEKVHLKEIEKIKIQQIAIQDEIDSLLARIEENNKNLSAQKERTGKILRELYKNGRFNTLKSLLAVNSAKDIGLAHVYLSYLAKNDLKLVEEFRKTLKELKDNKAKLEQSKNDQQRLLSEENTQLVEARKSSNDHKNLLQSIRQDQTVRDTLLQQKIAAKRELVELLNSLSLKSSSKSSSPSVFETMKGKLPWPTKGAVIAGFGTVKDPVHNVELQNDGIDIKSAIGTPVFVVAEGKVIFSDWNDAGGNIIVVDHGKGYYSLYAHLSKFEVTVGTEVRQGEMIGATGETGSLKGPVLHFELRMIKNGTEQRALNPADWLREVQ